MLYDFIQQAKSPKTGWNFCNIFYCYKNINPSTLYFWIFLTVRPHCTADFAENTTCIQRRLAQNGLEKYIKNPIIQYTLYIKVYCTAILLFIRHTHSMKQSSWEEPATVYTINHGKVLLNKNQTIPCHLIFPTLKNGLTKIFLTVNNGLQKSSPL